MRKRIITLLTVLLLSTTGLSAPFALPVYADEADDADANVSDLDDAGDEYTGFPDEELEDYDDTNEEDDTDSADATNPVKIKNNTKLSTTDANVVSKYQTMLNFAFRTTDDRYYTNDVFAVYSAAQWWLRHNNSNVVYAGGSEGVASYFEKHLYNVRDIFDDGKFFNAYTGQTDTVLVKGNGSSRLSSKFKLNSNYRGLNDCELDWRWFVHWKDLSVYKSSEPKPNCTDNYLDIDEISPCQNNIKDSENNDVKLYNSISTYEDYYKYILSKIESRQDYIDGLNEAKKEYEKAYGGKDAIKEAYNHVAVIKFLQDSTEYFNALDKSKNVYQATAIDWEAIKGAFDPVTGKVTITKNMIRDSYLLNKDNASCNRYILFRNNKRIESISEGDNKSPALGKYIADKNASDDGYYLYLYMKSGVARNTTECANMFKTDLNEETATKWWRSELDKDTRKPYKDAISRFAENHSFTTKDSDGVLQANYFNIYDAYCKNKLNLTNGAFVSRGKPVKADETKYGLNSPDNTVLNGYYCPSFAFWDGDIRKPMYMFPTTTRNLAKNYNKNYSKYKCANGSQITTQAFKSTNGSPVVYTDTAGVTGDFAVQLYTVGSPFTNAYASYQNSVIQPVDNYARSKTWKDAITFISNNGSKDADNVNGRYVLRTGLAVSVKSIQAPNYSKSSVENNIEQKYTFDKVTYQKYDANFADYVDGDDGDINDMVDKSVVKLADVIKISNNRSYIDTKAAYPMTTINNKLPLTPRTGDVTTSSDNTSSNIGDHIAYAWCGRLSNLSKDMSADTYNEIAKNKDTKKVVNYVAGKGKYYAHTFSADFKRYSVLYRVYKGAEVDTSVKRKDANCHNHYPSATCNQHKKTCNINKYSTVHDENCPLHVSKNSDMSDLTAQGVYCNCDKVACTCSKRDLKDRKWHTKNCSYYRQNLANAQYRNYFTTEKNKNHADENLDLLYKSITACNTSPILSAGYKQIQLNLYKNDGTTKKVTLYLGKYDDIFDRAYISQYWQTTRSNTDGGPGEVQDVIKKLYGYTGSDEDWVNDSVFDTTKVKNKPYKDSQAMYPEANTYHWETAPVDMYMHYDNNNYAYRSYSKLAGDKSLSENYYDSLVFAFDWYRAMPVSEVTVWYKPATYNVAYNSNVPTPSGTTSNTKVYLKADTSLSKGTEVSPYLVYYDAYSLSAPKDAFGTDRWNEMEKAAAVAGYTFDHWNVCLDGDTNAISAASNNANASTWYSSGNIISINPQGAASSMQFNINSEQTRYPFMYNNVMDNTKNSSHTINVYAVWKKSEYAVYYTSNQGAASKIFPDPSIITDEAKSSTSEYKDGYVPGNSSMNSKSKVLATETINSKIADPSNQFLRPGYFIIGYSLFDTGAPNDTCGTEYYNGAGHDSSAAWANHTGLVNNAGNTADGSGKLYSADSYGSDNLTAAYKRNTTNFSPYNHLTTYGNLLVSNPDKLNVRSFGDVGPIDFTKSPFNNAANNMGYYSNYIVTLRSSNAYATWRKAVADLQNAQADPNNVYSSDTMRGMMKQALKSLDDGLNSVTKDNINLYGLLCYKNNADIKELHPDYVISSPECEDASEYLKEYNNIIKDTKDISWTPYNDICDIISKYAHRLNHRNPDFIELDRDLDDVINNYNRCKNSMHELSQVINRMVSLRDELEEYEPHGGIPEKLIIDLRRRIKKYLDEYNFNSDSDPAAAYTALSNFDCEEAVNNVRNINTNAQKYLMDYVRAEYNEAFQVTPAAVFYAHWEPDRFYVRYNQNDANVASSRNPDGVQLSGNSKVEADPQPTYPGHSSLLLYPGQFSNKSVYYGDPTVTYANNQWQRVNAYNIIDKNEDSDYLGWSDAVITDGAGAYTAKFGDGTNFNYGEMLKTVFNSADGSPQVDDLTDKYYNYIYNLYAIFDDWPIMYIQEQAKQSGYSMLYDKASGLLTGASGVTSNLLDAHTKTELETHLLSSDANGNYRLPIIAYDREDSASNSSAVTNNNTWNKIAGPQVIQIQNPPNCTEVNRPTGVVTWIGANGYADPTAFPASLGYVNGSSNQGNMSNIAQIYIDPTGSNRKDDGSVGVRNTYYHLRFFDPSYVLNKVDNTQETKFELRYFIKDSRGKGYERQANFYVGANAKINIMDNP